MTSIIDTLGITQTIYARKALINMFMYVSDHYDALIQNVAVPLFYLNDEYLLLGNDAITQLNVIDSNGLEANSNVKYHSLLDVVDKASTPMGKRFVKFRLASPLVNHSKLTKIYDTVDLVRSKNIIESIDKYLKSVHDLERMFRKITLKALHPIQFV